MFSRNDKIYLQRLGWIAGQQSTIVSQIVPTSILEIIVAVTLNG